jgi:hypothetical protein
MKYIQIYIRYESLLMYHDLIYTFLTFSVLLMLMSVAIDFNATKQRHQKKIFFCACFSLFFFFFF